MRNGVLSCVLVVSFSCSLFGALLVHLQPDDAAQFISLISQVLRDAETNLRSRAWVQLNDIVFLLSSLSGEMIFYAIFSLCTGAIAAGAFAAVVAIIRSERSERNLAARVERDGLNQRPLLNRREFNDSHSYPPSSIVDRDVAARSSPLRRSSGANGLMSAWLPFRVVNCGLAGKMILIFAGAIAVLGLVALVLIHSMLRPSLKRHAFERAKIAALATFAEDAMLPLSKRNVAMWSSVIRKSASANGLAYILLEDDAGNILAHNFDVLPEQLLMRKVPEQFPIEAQSTIKLGDELIYEAKFRVGGGRSGAIRVGVRKSEIDAEISNVVTPVTQLIVLLVIAEICLAGFVAWRLIGPILKLNNAARRISIGELNVVPPGVDENSQLGELSRALERMRSSVKAAMARL